MQLPIIVFINIISIYSSFKIHHRYRHQYKLKLKMNRDNIFTNNINNNQGSSSSSNSSNTDININININMNMNNKNDKDDMMTDITLAKYISKREEMTISAAKKLIRRSRVEYKSQICRKTDLIIDNTDDLINLVKIKDARSSSADIKVDSLIDLKDVPKLEVIYEDDYMAIVVKPKGMPVYTAHGINMIPGETVRTALLVSLKPIKDVEGAVVTSFLTWLNLKKLWRKCLGFNLCQYSLLQRSRQKCEHQWLELID